MYFSRDAMAYVNGDGIPVVRVTLKGKRYVYTHPLTGSKLATSPATDAGIKYFAAKFWHRPTIEIR